MRCNTDQPLITPESTMSYLTAEQVLAAQKAHVETLFGLTHKAFEGVEKLVELNLQAAKVVMTEAADTTRAALGVKDAQELMALQQATLQPAAEKAVAYSRNVYEIATATNDEFVRVAETQFADLQKTFTSVVDSMVKNAPAGSETAVGFVKSAMAAANNAIESAQKVAKQAADVADANFQAVTGSVVKVAAAQQPKARARRAA
jgi:phasin family protein